MALRWYVAQCMPRYEGWAVKNVLQQSSEGFGVYWPRYETTKKNVIGRAYNRGVFPGYIFVQFDCYQPRWRQICHTFGIRKVLGATDNGASPLPFGFVESMIEAAPSGLIDLPKETGPVFNVGDQLKINEGPLAGKVGIFQYSEKGRVALLLSLLGAERSVILPVDKVSYAGASL